MQQPDEAVRNLRLGTRALVARTLKPTPRLSLPEWADTYRVLSRSSGAVAGRWRTSRVEVARGPMMAVTEPGVTIITAMVATQLLKTSLMENIIGYHAHLDPCPMLLVQPKDQAVETFSRERLSPMIRVTPVLSEIMGDGRTRRSDDTMYYKAFPGGFLALAGAGSPTNLAMRAIRITLLDEVDKYEATKEGDPISLAEERSSTFMSKRLSVRACSPTWEETSRIYHSYLESDQRRPYVPCPHCGHFNDLDFFRHVHWDKGRPETALVFCEECGAAWSNNRRVAALGGIQWRQTRAFVCCGEGQDPRQTRRWLWDEENQVGRAQCTQCGRLAVSNQHAGFTASKLHSPFLTMGQLAKTWMDCQDDIERKQAFYNTQLAVPYRVEATKEVAATKLRARQEVWEGEVPDQVLVVTAGIDTQPGTKDAEGRLEVEVVGWGLGEESWSLMYEVLTGDPAKAKVWNDLDELLLTPLRRQDSRDMIIRAACIDSGGHNTQEAYAFASSRGHRNVWAVKGASDRGGQWSPIWPTMSRARPGNVFQPGYRPVIIGVNAAKEAVRQRLLIADSGPGFCHFPVGRPPAYFDQLTAEKLVLERHSGALVRKWVQPAHLANEALDARVYAYAALWGLRHVRRLNLEQLAAVLSEPVAPAPAPPAQVMPPPQARRRVHRSTWISG